jgi:putative ABC transport system permease protein
MKNMIKLALKSIKYRKATLVLSIISVSMSVVLLLGIERIRSRVHDSFTSTISGTDLVVGARSGKISIILSNIFHIGYPNQNVSWKTYQAISSQNQVLWSIPLSLGDSHKGFSVVGTTDDFFDHYEYGNELKLKSASGVARIHGRQCVLGASVAKDLGYEIGHKVVVTHGMGHEDFITH